MDIKYTASISMVLYNEFDVLANDLLNGEDYSLLGWKKPTAKIRQGFKFWCDANFDNYKTVYENKLLDKSANLGAHLRTELLKVKDELIQRFLKIKNLAALNEEVEIQYRDLAVFVGQIEYLKWLFKSNTGSTIVPNERWDSDDVEAWAEEIETWVDQKLGNPSIEFQSFSLTEIPFLSILEPRGKLIFKQIKDFYSGKDIKELVLMFCALRDHDLIDPPIIQNLLSNQAGLNRIFTETFGNHKSDTAIRNHITSYIKNPGYPQLTDIKKHFNIIKGFLESLQTG